MVLQNFQMSLKKTQSANLLEFIAEFQGFLSEQVVFKNILKLEA